MQRRNFLALLGGAVVGRPLAARARHSAVPLVGLLSSASAESYAGVVKAFQRGLQDSGYVDGRNLTIEYRWAEGHYDRLPALAADLVRRDIAAIFAVGNVATRAAKAATASIAIVFVTGDDPVLVGLVPNLNRPAGNVTGLSTRAGTLPTKRLELLHELIPTATTIAMLVNPDNANAQGDVADAQSAAQSLGLSLLVVRAAGENEFASAFATMAQKGAGGILVNTDSFFAAEREYLVALASQHRIPAIFSWREFVESGGLMSYGASMTDAYRQGGVYVGKILHGSKPVDLPVLLPTKFELVINLKTAKALGLAVPPMLLALADEVIE